jgi:hypothetical protein
MMMTTAARGRSNGDHDNIVSINRSMRKLSKEGTGGKINNGPFLVKEEHSSFFTE